MNEVLKALEPQALDLSGYTGSATASQAISLKRIADALEGILSHIEHFGAAPHPSIY